MQINHTSYEKYPELLISVVAIEMTINICLLAFLPIFCRIVWQSGAVHRNFRLQLCNSACFYCLGTICRFYLFYVQYSGVPDEEIVDFFYPAQIIRSAENIFSVSIIGAFALERTIATYKWSWYEKGAKSTLLIMAVGILGILGFTSIYRMNRKMLNKMKAGAQVGNYSVAQTFQVKENVEVLKYMSWMGRGWIVSTVTCFAAYGYFAYRIYFIFFNKIILLNFGPIGFDASRALGYNVYEIFVALNVSAFYILSITGNSHILRQFRKLKLIRAFRNSRRLETILNICILLFVPVFCYVIFKSGAVHRNFRLQLCFAASTFSSGIIGRFFLSYFQVVGSIDRDIAIIKRRQFSPICAFVIERTIATAFCTWYEEGSRSAIMLATSYLKYWVSDNACILHLMSIGACGVVGFLLLYRYNLGIVNQTRSGAEIQNYSVSKSFQIKENIEVLQYIWRLVKLWLIFSVLTFSTYGFFAYVIFVIRRRGMNHRGLSDSFLLDFILSVMEEAHHFVKLNSTVFNDSPFIMYPILILEIILITAYCILWPLLCIAVKRAGVMHRNFRIQICLASSYLFLGQISRLIMIYYQLRDVSLDDDTVMYLCDLIKVTVLGYYCSLMGSFAAERYVATHFWKWYEKGSKSTLLVLLATESFMIIPNFIEAMLNLNGTVSIESNFYFLATVFGLSSVAFLRTYSINVGIHKNLSQGAQLGYSVSRTFQVRENVVVMKVISTRLFFKSELSSQYMFGIMVFPSPFALVAFIAFSIKMFGSEEWQFTRDLSYALYDLLIAVTIYREFCRMGILNFFYFFSVVSMEHQPHFVKLNSTSIASAPFLICSIIVTENGFICFGALCGDSTMEVTMSFNSNANNYNPMYGRQESAVSMESLGNAYTEDMKAMLETPLDLSDYLTWMVIGQPRISPPPPHERCITTSPPTTTCTTEAISLMAGSTLPIMIVLTRLRNVLILGMRQNMVEVKSEPDEEEFGYEKDTTPLPSTSRQMIASPIIRHRKTKARGYKIKPEEVKADPTYTLREVWSRDFPVLRDISWTLFDLLLAIYSLFHISLAICCNEQQSGLVPMKLPFMTNQRRTNLNKAGIHRIINIDVVKEFFVDQRILLQFSQIVLRDNQSKSKANPKLDGED
ncbi:hypothetical protein PRIPAC_82537, partial [Pristionchus pacificus]|uniref:G protein-coupled receptor n=1 Tax=Pristionchus pacificus TaxID=54126 RepID=A0A2A6C2A8_PRIPA